MRSSYRNLTFLTVCLLASAAGAKPLRLSQDDSKREIAVARAAAPTPPKVAKPVVITAEKPLPPIVPEPAASPEPEVAPPLAARTTKFLSPDAPISTGAVSALSAEDFGLYDETNGGFSYDLWQGTNRAEFDRLIATLPRGTASAATREMLTRLLLTHAKAPQGAPESGFLLERLEAVVALGQKDKALETLTALPQSFSSDKLATLAADLTLLAGDQGRFCAEVEKNVEKYDTPPWQKRLIFCQALGKKGDETQLGLDLLEEQAHDGSGFFRALTQQMLNPKKKLSSLPENLSLGDTAMLLTLPAPPITAEWVETAPLVALPALLTHETLPPPVRATAAERAVLYGLAEPQALAEAYLAMPAAKSAKPLTGIAERAAFYRQFSQSPKERKLALAAHGLSLFDGAHLQPLAMKLLLPGIREATEALRGSKDTAGLEPFLILMAGGEETLAGRYINLLPTNQEQAQKAVGRLMLAFARTMASEEADIPSAPLSAATAPEDIRRLFRLYALMDTFHLPVPATQRASLFAARVKYDVELPSPALLDAFQEALNAHDSGRTLLLSALLLGTGDLAHVSDATLTQTLTAWQKDGLEKDAAALGREAASVF